MERLFVTSALVFVHAVALAQPSAAPAPASLPPGAAQQPPASQQPAAQPPAVQQPEATPPGATPPAAVPGEPAAQPQPAGQPQPAAPDAPGTGAQPQQPPASAQHVMSDQEARRIAAERWRTRAMLAQARAERAAQARAQEAEPEPRVRGDAGAALALGLSLEMPWYSDPGFDAFHDDDVTARFGLWAGYDVVSLQDDLILAAEIGWGTESESDGDLLGGALHTELQTHAFFAGAQLRWVPIAMLQPYARLTGGAALVDMELTSRSPAQTFTEGGGDPFDSAVSPFGSLGLGLMLRTPTRMFENRRGAYASLSFGLMFEGGYTLAAPVDMKLDGDGPDGRDIPLVESELGELERSGPYARISGVARF